jgi:hypothetical protein
MLTGLLVAVREFLATMRWKQVSAKTVGRRMKRCLNAVVASRGRTLALKRVENKAAGGGNHHHYQIKIKVFKPEGGANGSVQ